MGNFGRFEYWFAMIKVATILVFVLLGATLVAQRTRDPSIHDARRISAERPGAPLLAMGFALYTFGRRGVRRDYHRRIALGKRHSPRDQIDLRDLASVYLGAIVILVGVMPWNRAGVTESPFVTVFRIPTFPAASHIMTFVILTAALSGANAALYVVIACLVFSGAIRMGPAALGRLNAAGSPRLAFAGIFVWCCGGAGPGKRRRGCIRLNFGGLADGMLLSWLVSLAAHFRFRQKL